jgi:hypothetical protein
VVNAEWYSFNEPNKAALELARSAHALCSVQLKLLLLQIGDPCISCCSPAIMVKSVTDKAAAHSCDSVSTMLGLLVLEAMLRVTLEPLVLVPQHKVNRMHTVFIIQDAATQAYRLAYLCCQRAARPACTANALEHLV